MKSMAVIIIENKNDFNEVNIYGDGDALEFARVLLDSLDDETGGTA